MKRSKGMLSFRSTTVVVLWGVLIVATPAAGVEPEMKSSAKEPIAKRKRA